MRCKELAVNTISVEALAAVFAVMWIGTHFAISQSYKCTARAQLLAQTFRSCGPFPRAFVQMQIFYMANHIGISQTFLMYMGFTLVTLGSFLQLVNE